MANSNIQAKCSNNTIEVAIPFGILRFNLYDNVAISDIFDVDATYTSYIKKDIYSINIGKQNVNFQTKYYREKLLEKGYYIGHHFGKRIQMKIEDRNVYLYQEEHDESCYKKFIWSYLFKYILTVYALTNDSLHLKGTALLNKSSQKALIVLGRGNSGKTTLCDMLVNTGKYSIISNTHLILKNDEVWGINSWRRKRDINGNEIYEKPLSNYYGGPYKIEKIILVDKNNMNSFDTREINRDVAYVFVKFFSAAICNYDLKEDIFDYVGNHNINSFSNLCIRENSLVTELLNKHSVFYLNYDLNINNILNHILAYVKR